MGGGIGDASTPRSYYTKAPFYMSTIAHFTFYIIVNVIMRKIVFGIINTTFGTLRDEANFIEDDI
jgi:hypothetical protein